MHKWGSHFREGQSYFSHFLFYLSSHVPLSFAHLLQPPSTRGLHSCSSAHLHWQSGVWFFPMVSYNPIQISIYVHRDKYIQFAFHFLIKIESYY